MNAGRIDVSAYHGSMEADSHSVLLRRLAKYFGDLIQRIMTIRQIILPGLPKLTILEKELPSG
jgi:hypothetical protein